ncbi:7tm 7 domain containing protein [Asbolus verrucosus]|uniref:Gustatory receptor n=1 Tax=Asbolus verrucosus TaxID=1661398 RepID=A0A482W5P7_ASBVE|nr:7tm 7 domain containing protein [Asbolus verrucosus]
MFTTDENITSSLHPLLMFLRINGFVLFCLHKIKTNEKIAYFEKTNLIIYICHILYTGYAAKNAIKKFCMAPDTLRKVYALVFSINAYALIGVNFIYDKYRNKKILQILRKIYIMDQKLRNSGVILDYKKLKNYSALIMFVEGACYMYFNFDTAIIFWVVLHRDPKVVVLDFLYYTVLHATQVAMTGKCVTFFAIIENIYKHLNEKLERVETSAKLMRDMQCLYHDTYGLVMELNEVIAFQLVVPFCVTFIMVVFHIYYQMVNSALQSSVTVLLWLSTVLVKIVLVIVQIQKAISAANKIKQTVVKLSLTKNRQIRRELLHEEVKISGAKFFDVEISLVAQFFGKAIQYLLILYQSYKNFT